MPKSNPKKNKPAAASSSNGAAGSKGSPSSPFPVLPEGAHDLASLQAAVGAPDEAFRRVVFRHQDEASFYKWGVQADTGNILADVPRFVSSALRILAALEPSRRELVMLSQEVLAMLVDEAVVLEGMSRGHEVVATSEASDRTDREVVLKKHVGEGVALRDRVLGGLRSAVGEVALAPLRKVAGDASSPDALAKGLRAVADFIDRISATGGEDDVQALAAFHVGAPRAAELRAKAAAILEASVVKAATGKRVSKRVLDIQDGRVLVLVDMVHRAFRLARRADRSILLPEMNRLAGLFSAGSSAVSAGPAASAPDAGASPAPA
jgi:hypothetical protein